MTDGISDLLTRLRNGAQARHESVKVPYSKIKESILSVLNSNGFIGKFSTSSEGVKKEIVVSLKYSEEGEPVILGSKRLSRPGCRKYVKGAEIPSATGALGIYILSTPKGVMTSREATEQKIGGELICEIW